MRPPLTQVDLTDNLNVIQARHELHRAVDFGGEPELAAWARKWGEAGLRAADKASEDGQVFSDQFINRLQVRTDAALSRCAALATALHAEKPDLPAALEAVAQVRSRLLAINEAIEPET